MLAAPRRKRSWSLTCRSYKGDLRVVGKKPADEQTGGGFIVQRSLHGSLLCYGTWCYTTFISIATKVCRNFLSNLALTNERSGLWRTRVKRHSQVLTLLRWRRRRETWPLAPDAIPQIPGSEAAAGLRGSVIGSFTSRSPGVSGSRARGFVTT